jgi:hypothetical protein
MSMIFIILLSIGITWFVTDLFRNGRELNKMVMTFSKMHLMLNELTLKIDGGLGQDKFKEELFVLAYLFRREIVFRLDEYKWSMNTPLIIPGVSSERIELWVIYQQTINQLLFLGRELDLEEITQSIMDGSADEKTMLNYYNRTIEPIIAAIVDEMKRKFLTKTARSQRQTVMYFRDPFKLVPVNEIAEIADKFTRNEIMTSNEIRQIVGMKPADDPSADELRNKNLNQSGKEIEAKQTPEKIQNEKEVTE